MDEIKSLLLQVLSNQVVLFKRLEKIENKLEKKSRLTGDQSYVKELKKEAEKFLKYIE
jgi:hypothetical protein